ncbi:MAG: DUF488 domain-containing protein [Candidatus Tyrphobacter sp.]
MPTIALKRAYEKAARGDGFRILVDRLWPRGIKKEDLHLDAWAKDLAPSTKLRKWFAHDEAKWPEFRKRYRAELAASDARTAIRALLASAKDKKTITLLYGAKDREHNEAVVLRVLFERASAR